MREMVSPSQKDDCSYSLHGSPPKKWMQSKNRTVKLINSQTKTSEIVILDKEKASNMIVNAFSWDGLSNDKEPNKSLKENIQDEGHICKLLLDELIKLNNPAVTAICNELIKKCQANYQTLVTIINYLTSRLHEAEEIHEFDRKGMKNLKAKLSRSKKLMGKYRKKYNAIRIKYKEQSDTIRRLVNEKSELIARLNEEKCTRKTQREDAIKNFLNFQMLVIRCNEYFPKNEWRYPDEMKPYYVLLSFAGEFWYNILQRILILPTYRTVQKYRKEMLDHYQLTEENLNGSKESISILRSKLWNTDFGDDRCVLAIDAASIKPQISIDLTGKVSGMINDFPNNLTPEDALLLRTDHSAYKNFVLDNLDFICKYEFVVLLCPLDQRQLSIPIAYVETNSGTATAEMRSLLDQLKSNASECGFEVIGYAFDGCRQYLCYCNEFLEGIDETVWVNGGLYKPLSEQWSDEGFFYFFYDMLHLVKCDRYRKAKNKETCIWPTCTEATIDKSSFAEFNEMIKDEYEDDESLRKHIIPEWLLSDAKEMKMHDDIPLRLFTPQHCNDLFEQERFDLLLSILHSTYLIEAVMNENISREQRIKYLTIGFCIMVLFYCSARDNLNDCQRSNSTEGCALTLFNEDFVKKYIVLA